MQYGESGRVAEGALGGGERVAGDEAELVEPPAQVEEHVELHETLERHQVVAAARALLDARLERRLRPAQCALCSAPYVYSSRHTQPQSALLLVSQY